MASGQIKNGSTSVYNLNAWLLWSSVPDPAANTSAVTITLQMRNRTGARRTVSGVWALQVGADSANLQASIDLQNDPDAWITICSRTVTVAHENDGTKSVFLKASGDLIQSSYYNTVQLDAITRVCSIGSLTPRTLRFEDDMAISIIRPSGAQYAAMWMSLGQRAAWINMDGSATAYTWELPSEWSDQMGGQSSLWATARLYTYRDALHQSVIGYTDQIWYAEVADNPPSVDSGWASLSPSNPSEVPASWSAVYVARYSRIAAEFDSSDVHPMSGATIARYKLIVAGATYIATLDTVSSLFRAVTVPIQASGSVPVAVAIEDSRGNVYSEVRTISVNDYSAPNLYDISVYRCDSIGIADEDGGYISASANISYSSVGGRNTCALEARYKQATGSWVDAWTTLTPGTPALLGGGNLSPLISYDVQIRAKDKITETMYEARIASKSVLIHAGHGNNGIGFGKYDGLAGWLDSAWGIRTDGDAYVARDLTVGRNFIWSALDIRAGTVEIQSEVDVTVPFTEPMAHKPVVLVNSHKVLINYVSVNSQIVDGVTWYTGFTVHGASGQQIEIVPYIALYWGGAT